MKTSYNNGAYRSQKSLYRRVDHAYIRIVKKKKEEVKENFFVSYAVRGPTFVSNYGGIQYNMPLRGPQPDNSPVNQPGPLSSQSQCVEYLSDGNAVI
jgi:hypothetical protein